MHNAQATTSNTLELAKDQLAALKALQNYPVPQSELVRQNSPCCQTVYDLCKALNNTYPGSQLYLVGSATELVLKGEVEKVKRCPLNDLDLVMVLGPKVQPNKPQDHSLPFDELFKIIQEFISPTEENKNEKLRLLSNNKGLVKITGSSHQENDGTTTPIDLVLQHGGEIEHDTPTNSRRIKLTYNNDETKGIIESEWPHDLIEDMETKNVLYFNKDLNEDCLYRAFKAMLKAVSNKSSYITIQPNLLKNFCNYLFELIEQEQRNTENKIKPCLMAAKKIIYDILGGTYFEVLMQTEDFKSKIKDSFNTLFIESTNKLKTIHPKELVDQNLKNTMEYKEKWLLECSPLTVEKLKKLSPYNKEALGSINFNNTEDIREFVNACKEPLLILMEKIDEIHQKQTIDNFEILIPIINNLHVHGFFDAASEALTAIPAKIIFQHAAKNLSEKKHQSFITSAINHISSNTDKTKTWLQEYIQLNFEPEKNIKFFLNFINASYKKPEKKPHLFSQESLGQEFFPLLLIILKLEADEKNKTNQIQTAINSFKCQLDSTGLLEHLNNTPEFFTQFAKAWSETQKSDQKQAKETIQLIFDSTTQSENLCRLLQTTTAHLYPEFFHEILALVEIKSGFQEWRSIVLKMDLGNQGNINRLVCTLSFTLQQNPEPEGLQGEHLDLLPKIFEAEQSYSKQLSTTELDITQEFKNNINKENLIDKLIKNPDFLEANNALNLLISSDNDQAANNNDNQFSNLLTLIDGIYNKHPNEIGQPDSPSNLLFNSSIKQLIAIDPSICKSIEPQWSKFFSAITTWIECINSLGLGVAGFSPNQTQNVNTTHALNLKQKQQLKSLFENASIEFLPTALPRWVDNICKYNPSNKSWLFSNLDTHYTLGQPFPNAYELSYLASKGDAQASKIIACKDNIYCFTYKGQENEIDKFIDENRLTFNIKHSQEFGKLSVDSELMNGFSPTLHFETNSIDAVFPYLAMFTELANTSKKLGATFAEDCPWRHALTVLIENATSQTNDLLLNHKLPKNYKFTGFLNPGTNGFPVAMGWVYKTQNGITTEKFGMFLIQKNHAVSSKTPIDHFKLDSKSSSVLIPHGFHLETQANQETLSFSVFGELIPKTKTHPSPKDTTQAYKPKPLILSNTDSSVVWNGQQFFYGNHYNKIGSPAIKRLDSSYCFTPNKTKTTFIKPFLILATVDVFSKNSGLEQFEVVWAGSEKCMYQFYIGQTIEHTPVSLYHIKNPTFHVFDWTYWASMGSYQPTVFEQEIMLRVRAQFLPAPNYEANIAVKALKKLMSFANQHSSLAKKPFSKVRELWVTHVDEEKRTPLMMAGICFAAYVALERLKLHTYILPNGPWANTNT